MPMRVLVTGATGFVGSHVAEFWRGRGDEVATIARPGSDTDFVRQWGVQVHTGDLGDPAAVGKAVEGADLVVHCAAKVGEWGPVEDYRAVNVEATRTLLEACRGRPLRRFVHVSSLGVYPAQDHHGSDETVPAAERHIDGYTQTKAEAERLALAYHRDHGVPVVVVRPGFIYGPRDRTVLPEVADKLRRGHLFYIGSGEQAMNTTYVGNLIDVLALAAERPEAIGQIYNVTDGETVSKRRFLEAIADGLGLPRPRRSLPLWFARLGARVLEGQARWRGQKRTPLLTQARLKFLGLNLDYSIAKAKRELGYQPRWSFDQAMAETLAWFRQKQTTRTPTADPV